ncbi:MAG: AAA family ATPase [Clostridia bacterium]|nr:AAA family ATPase [Clostridia bacterium]
MIRRIKLRNFESHEDSEIEFTEGLNLLIGQSNQGKSSIIRGLALVVANQFDKDQVRTGCEFCEVTVETDKGYVRAQRGEAVNRWEVKPADGEVKTYRSIGTGVPAGALEILGMGEVTHGDISELPNIMFQHEKHYMLAEINGKKATANQIARMMDDAIGIGGMEELIKSMADDLTAWKKRLNQVNAEISDVKTDLIDDVIFKDYEDCIGEARRMQDQIDEDARLIADSGDLSRRVSKAVGRVSFLGPAVDMAGGVLSLPGEISGLLGRLRDMRRLRGLERTLGTAAQADGILKAAAELKALTDLMRILRKLHSSRFEGYGEIMKLFNDLSGLVERAKSARQRLEYMRKLYARIQAAGKECDVFKDKLEKSEEALREIREGLDICPFCGAELKHEQ